MDKVMLESAVALTEQIMRTYYSQRDIYAVLNQLAPNASWIGPGEREKKYTYEDISTYFEQGKDSVPTCVISEPDLRAIALGEDYCLVTGSMMICTTPESKLLLKVDQRVSFTYQFTNGAFRVVHMHISNPYGEMNPEEYFPHKIGSQSYEYLQQLLKQKTEVLNMIAENINGGLKGSNDDDSYSYFYVNEGLPRMLGYTYDEFMEKTGGTAVGAVYPPDLAAALADCERCFAQGIYYSTEYRMEKKDGSFIWVLDSGQKAVDSEGITRINSIIIDITPLKQALFDLEVERERYRIALENITGAMCEYDVTGDLFTLYVPGEENGQGITNLKLPRFLEAVHGGELIYPKDRDAFIKLCIGQRCDPLELRARFFNTEDSWHWYQFSCSVILDITGKPIRSIGVLKDITEEKQKNLELQKLARHDGLTGLLNQTATKSAIQSYLAESKEAASRKGALFMLDLDHFKEINDSYGHLYGNDVLVQTAHILESIAGTEGIVGRIGGDEFIVLLKNTVAEDAVSLADEIVHRVCQIGVDCTHTISCSIGIACQSSEDESFTQFFGRADKALYQAKDRGKNQWFMDKTDSFGNNSSHMK